MFKAREVIDDNNDRAELTETVANVSITIQDVNDEPPRFSQKEFQARIPENAALGTPLVGLDIRVSDSDNGPHSMFNLELRDPSGFFSLEPSRGAGSVAASIRLMKTPLDYEDPNQRKFVLILTARENGTQQLLSSTASVIVSVIDVNDNRPVFSSSMYTATISESAVGGTTVTTVAATDSDSGDFGVQSLRYSLSGIGAELFSIDEATGTIVVAQCSSPGVEPCADFETRSNYFLHVQAADESGRGFKAFASLKIALADSNDNPPIFEKRKYEARIREGEKQPSMLVKATDADVTSEVIYSLKSIGADVDDEGSGLNIFTVNERTGKITVVNQTSGAVLPSHMRGHKVFLVLSATDGIHKDSCEVEIVIEDTNNNEPVFSLSRYEVTLPEGTKVGENIIATLAEDADVGNNAAIQYRLHSGAFGDFEINPESGVVTLVKKLNFERHPEYNMVILAVDQGTHPLTGTATLVVEVISNTQVLPVFYPMVQRFSVHEDIEQRIIEVTVVDVNDDPPVFIDDDGTGEYKMKVQEGLPSGTLLRRFLAVDRDSAISHYTLRLPPNSPEYFVVDEKSGKFSSCITYFLSFLLGVKKKPSCGKVGQLMTGSSELDFETTEEVEFELEVFDSGMPQLSATLKVLVELLNVNDESPVFSLAKYEVEIKENAGRSSPVAMVEATDKDKGEFGVVAYGLSGDLARDFQIDGSGTITVVNAALLDREVSSTLTVYATATDGKNVATVPVILTLLDDNDNPPVFDRREYEVTVEDRVSVESPAVLIRVQASDPDEGLGGSLLYSIVSGNTDDAFQLDPIKGFLRASGKHPLWNLPSKPEIVELKVRVRDGAGHGPFFDETIVRLHLRKSNRYRPVFVRPTTPNLVIRLTENEAARTLYMFLAEDADGNDTRNGLVSYHLKTGSENVQEVGPFFMVESTGELSLERSLDREAESEFKLIVVAQDGGGPLPLETLLPVSVIVEDVNDNDPVFEPNSLELEGNNDYLTHLFEVSEGAAIGTIVGVLEAEDADEGKNARIFYHLVARDSAKKKKFAVDLIRGEIVCLKALDREEKSEYEMVVLASNSPEFPAMWRNLTYGDIFNDTKNHSPSLAFVRINILDLNDNAPKFAKKMYYAAIPTKAGVGYSFMKLKARDPDFGINGTVTYRISSSNLHRVGSNDSLGSVVPSPFAINSVTGELSTSILVEEFRADWFLLEIAAKEIAEPFRVATCFVEVWFHKEEQVIRVVMAKAPEEVATEEVQGGVVGELSRLSGAQLVPAGLRHHIDQYNHLQPSWTDLAVIAVHPQKRVLMDVSEILFAVDTNYDFLRQHYQDYSIENVVPAVEPVKTSMEELKPMEILLIALVLVLIIGLITAISVCCCLKHWVPKPSKEYSDKVGIIPPLPEPENGTTNPLWLGSNATLPMSPSKIYEEQELTMQVSPGQDPNLHNNHAPSPTDVHSNVYAAIEADGDVSRDNGDTRDSSTNPEDTMYLGEYATLRNSPPIPWQGPRIPGMGSTFPYEDMPSWVDRSFNGPMGRNGNSDPPVIVGELLD
ncbi:unnamed protein product [Notodromas monacha]|uniref:Cadherin domain-containing protein n=1 Tax=Notodromas monacha TaxID=399045 RepID=A0A7R9BJX8_9CRUS|nr:unnamed protein product [Notodromas monacha]CAG0916855.1 unnamed protein product [Notodromas monacha]